MNSILKPTPPYPSFYQAYLDKVPDDGNLLQHLQTIIIETEELVKTLSPEQLTYRYDTGKWDIKDILLHLADCERVIIYRAMRIARGDKTNLPAFDENLFVLNANADNRSTESLLSELRTFRNASIHFIHTLTDESLDKSGTANNYPLTARLLVNHLYGHHKHHLLIMKERYLRMM